MKLGFWAYIVIIASTSIVFLVIGLYLFNDFNSSLGLVSLYIAFTSIAMAINSHFLSEDTDKRINDIANTHFLTIISSFEDRRLEIQKFPDNHQLFLWKAVVDLDKAEEISRGKCKIKSKHYKTLLSRFLTLMDSLNYVKFMFLCESVNNIIGIYNKVFKIVPENIVFKQHKDENKSNKEKAEWYFRQLFDLKSEIPVNDDLFKLIKKTTHVEENRWKEFSKFEKKLIKEIEEFFIGKN